MTATLNRITKTLTFNYEGTDVTIADQQFGDCTNWKSNTLIKGANYEVEIVNGEVTINSWGTKKVSITITEIGPINNVSFVGGAPISKNTEAPQSVVMPYNGQQWKFTVDADGEYNVNGTKCKGECLEVESTYNVE